MGEEPLNLDEVFALRAELRSPRFAADVASRARSPEIVRPTNEIDHVEGIMHLEERQRLLVGGVYVCACCVCWGWAEMRQRLLVGCVCVRGVLGEGLSRSAGIKVDCM